MSIYDGLSAAAQNDRISHAYIICGEEKEAFLPALYIAMAANCLSHKTKPCRVCNSCRKVNSSNHPDVSIIRAEGSSIGIEAVRQLQKEIYLKPYEGRKRVYIIAEGEKMTAQAQNCMLKVLEEPPGTGIIVITSNNYHNLLPTVISRCQVLKLNTEVSVLNHQKYKNLMVCFMEEDFVSASSRIDELLKEEDKSVSEFLDYMLMALRDMLLLKVAGNPDLLYIKDNGEFMRKMAAKLNLGKIDRLISAVNSAQEGLKFNANPQLAMEVLLLEIQEV